MAPSAPVDVPAAAPDLKMLRALRARYWRCVARIRSMMKVMEELSPYVL
jgi:hypothetical protein